MGDPRASLPQMAHPSKRSCTLRCSTLACQLLQWQLSLYMGLAHHWATPSKLGPSARHMAQPRQMDTWCWCPTSRALDTQRAQQVSCKHACKCLAYHITTAAATLHFEGLRLLTLHFAHRRLLPCHSSSQMHDSELCGDNAGLTGMLLAISSVCQQASAPIKHLRTVNPYVGAALVEKKPLQSQRLQLPREHAALQQSSQPCTAGTSSFGMSGVNAHMLVTAPTASPSMPHREVSSSSACIFVSPMCCISMQRPEMSAIQATF